MTEERHESKNSYIISTEFFIFVFFSGKPLSFVTVFTAFGVVLLGLNLSFALLLIEMIVAKYGYGRCKRIMNAYNHRMVHQPNHPDVEWQLDNRRQLSISDNPC